MPDMPLSNPNENNPNIEDKNVYSDSNFIEINLIFDSASSPITVSYTHLSRGIRPAKDRSYCGLYHSPLREDHMPSMKVDLSLIHI